MIPRWQRRLYNRLMNPLMWLNGRFYRFFRAPKKGLKVQLGPGQESYLQGWLNVDLNFITARIDLWANLEHGLPFRTGSVDAFYSYHVIEHLAYDKVTVALKEIHRCLADNGIVRIGVPHAGNAAKAYVEGKADWFKVFPRDYRSIGGKFANFVFCTGEHHQIFDLSFLTELMEDAGFCDIVELRPKKTCHPKIYDNAVMDIEWESHPDMPQTLVVEAVKKTP